MMETTLAGHYRIIKPLGGGGFGQTFLAQDQHLPGHPSCVVKQLKPRTKDEAAIETAKRLFEREVETLYRLGNHDQIPRLLAHFEQDQEFYLVQDYIEGQTLQEEFTDSGLFSEASVIVLLQDILRVLAFVHEQNVIHRDIKPANLIRRRQDGRIILIDFGAVKEVSNQGIHSAGETSFTVAVGSPGYMPSEQQAFKPQFSSDIYAVGMVCLQALTGLYPRDVPRDPKNGEIYCALFRDRAPISPGLAAILEKMVRYDYRQRYPSATEALRDLQQMGGEGETAIAQIPVISQSSQPGGVPSGQFTTFPQLDEPEGQVGLESPLYIERPPIETDCYETIVKPGALIRIKAPRQMGKSSLMSRILHYATLQGCQAVPVYFQQADVEVLTNLDQFLQWFAASVTYELNLEDRLADYWKGILGSKNKCTNYFQRYLLSEITRPLVLGLDEVDLMFQYPVIATDFFGLLRAWHERSKNELVWKKLRLVIVHSKEVYIPLNINQSPFNVGLPIELPELTPAQVRDLVKRHHLDWGEDQVEQLMSMVGGHPYLLRVALYQIARSRMTLEQLLQTAPTEEGIYGDHLRRHLSNLKDDPNLAEAAYQVVSVDSPMRIETGLAFKLHSMGLVKFQGNDVLPLCNLYRQYLCDRLGTNA